VNALQVLVFVGLLPVVSCGGQTNEARDAGSAGEGDGSGSAPDGSILDALALDTSVSDAATPSDAGIGFDTGLSSDGPCNTPQEAGLCVPCGSSEWQCGPRQVLEQCPPAAATGLECNPSVDGTNCVACQTDGSAYELDCLGMGPTTGTWHSSPVRVICAW
jgi:hypothetical protein